MRSPSVLICTRNRTHDLLAAVRSLLVGLPQQAEVIVVDQSDTNLTELALADAVPDERIRYHRSLARGKGAALNQGLRLARADIMVCTDDDCEAPPGWVVDMTRTLTDQPSAAVAFCNVVAPPYDPTTGYVPTYAVRRARLLRTVTDTCAGHGLGAGMAVRRHAVLAIGGFDEAVGPGGHFPSGDDWDITSRVLLKGWAVYETPELSILHNGFRNAREGWDHTRRDWLAIGAVCAKPLRAGYGSAAALPLWELSINALWPPLNDLLHGRKPRGLARVSGFLQGFAQGLATPVDRATLLFSRHPNSRHP